MRKRKDFTQANTDSGSVNDAIQSHKPIFNPAIPDNKKVEFGKNANNIKSFDFTKHYGQGFDEITSACHQVILIFFSENTVEKSTIANYCKIGFNQIYSYLKIYRSAMGRDIGLSDINIELMENYIQHLKREYPDFSTAKSYYASTKSILSKMRSMGWLEQFDFPRNPFPNSNRKAKGHRSFSKAERKRVAQALKNDLNLILKKTEPLSSYELVVCLLAIALRSGMNTTPLLEMTIDSIQEHPLKKDRKLLVLYKRRGNATHIQSLRNSQTIQNAQTVLADVALIVDHIINVNRIVREKIGSNLVFTYESVSNSRSNDVISVDNASLRKNVSKWVDAHNIKNDNGEPLQVNISRFRKTFENRIWELSGGDPFVTAALSNHSVRVSDTHYLEAPIEAEKNFNYMGKVRTLELLETVAVVESNTPVSKCSKPPDTLKNGNKNYCTDFLSCVRCQNMVVTKDDLPRLFSFYWLLIYEREEIGAKRWSKYFAHIIRIIDSDIATQFDDDHVKTIKAEVKVNPHSAWKHRNQLEPLA